jgi:hypothetical protein
MMKGLITGGCVLKQRYEWRVYLRGVELPVETCPVSLTLYVTIRDKSEEVYSGEFRFVQKEDAYCAVCCLDFSLIHFVNGSLLTMELKETTHKVESQFIF